MQGYDGDDTFVVMPISDVTSPSANIIGGTGCNTYVASGAFDFAYLNFAFVSDAKPCDVFRFGTADNWLDVTYEEAVANDPYSDEE